ncbi:NHLP bacteriocin system secretion protein [Paramagnetospirillum caucaseum]|nr:NHLP bacteriocin system secretion protein [Paramagnetospirillum caucaseum]
MSTNQSIFRQVALERLSTPEQLDQVMRVTSPLSWLMAGSVAVLIVTALIWSLVATIPVKVSAQGILISPGGVLTVSSEHGGRITELLVRSGQRVSVGQLVARLEQPDVRQDLDTAKAELGELHRQRQQIIEFQGRDNKVQIALLAQKKKDIQETLRHLGDRIHWLSERERNEAGLLAKQYIDRNRYINTKIELNSAVEARSKAANELKQVERDETTLSIGKERELLDKEMLIGAASRKIEALEERLARQSTVISPYSGDIVEFKVNQGEVVDKGKALFSLLPARSESAAQAKGGDLIAVVYVNPNDGKKVRPGMPVQVAPSTVKREEYGFIMGHVKAVAEIPSTSEGMMRILKNQQLVTSLSGGGAPFEVVVELERDPATPTGFKWSSSRGPEAEINTSTLADSTITVRSIHLISLAIPPLEALLDR